MQGFPKSATKGEDKGTRLVSLKETTVERLSENASQADFKRWIKERYMHLESAGWRGITAIMKRVRMLEYPTKGVSQDIIDEVHADTDKNSSRASWTSIH